MHTAPNPGPPLKKVHDISFDKEKTLMRTISTEGEGPEAREGSVVRLHLEILQPGEDGQLERIYRSRDDQPDGLQFVLGRDLHSEAIGRTVMHCKPGAVIDSLCTCPDIAFDPTLGIGAREIPAGAAAMMPLAPPSVQQGVDDVTVTRALAVTG